MIISLVAAKGGTGKTTSAIFLACAAHLAQPEQEIILLDADPQASAIDWAQEAQKTKTPLPFQVEEATPQKISAAANSEAITFVDTAPGFTEFTGLIIQQSDLCIIPTAPTQLDMRRAWATLDAIQRVQATGAILITQANPRTIDYRKTMHGLATDGASFFDTTIKRSTKIAQAFGTTPRKMYGYEDVWQEIRKASQA